jgi:hypothetical protein
MGFGTGISLTAIGAILAFAVQDHINNVDLVAVGWILMAAGIFAIILSMIFWSSWGGFNGRHRTTIVERDDVL